MKLLIALGSMALIFQIGQVSNADTPMLPISQADVSRLCGLQLSLDDKHTEAQLWFQTNGTLPADMGIKNGPICAPVLMWSLSKDGVLTATLGDVVQFRWTAISFVRDGICVRSGGKTEHYISVKKQLNSN
jgi:hypothetical protein